MAIATVVNIKGEVFAVNKDGVKRRLQKGDQLQEGEVLVTAPGSSAELDMGGGKIVNVAEQQTFAVDGAVGGPAQPNAASSALESAAAAQKVVQALASGDANALLEAEAAAAGLSGGADGGGSSFVQLLRISEGVTGVNYEFGSFSQGAVDQPTPGAIEEITTTPNPPTILVGDGGLVAESAEAEVFEPALVGGSSNAGAGAPGRFVDGKFLVSDPQGVDTLVSVTINGTVILMADLVGSVIPGASGTLTITGFDPATGLATFTYELTAVSTDVDGVDETDIFTFTTTDGEFTSNEATITITIVDDVPTAVVDVADTLVEDAESGFVSGNVLDNDLSGADAPKAFDAWDDSANAATESALAAYGTLVLNNDGSYSFTLNNSLPAVQALTSQSELPSFVLAYTMKDADGDIGPATLTINIQGADDSASVTVAIEGADSTVVEAGLTSVGDTSETDSDDSFQVSASDGIASVTVGGTIFTLAQLQGFSVGSPSAGINTGEGTLVITGYSGTAFSGTVSYSYTLNAAQPHTLPGNDSLTDSVAVSVLGIGGTTANANLTISIVDDVPTAVVDVADTLVEDGLSFVSGNVLDNDSAGADTAKAFDAWDDSANASTVSALAAYGTLVLNTDGTYSFTLNNSLPAVQALTSQSEVPPFVLAYTMKDADGDISPATLTINIQGADDSASVTIEGADSTVFEAGLTSVTDTSETDDNDSFQVSATDGIDSVTVGGTTFTLAELKLFSELSPSDPIDTGEGTLVITGYSSSDGDKTATITYSYTLNTEQPHTQPGNDTLADSVTLSVLGVGGTTASANLTISIVDDVPVFTIVNDGTDIGNTAGISVGNPATTTTYTGQFADWKYGADGAQGTPTLSDTSGDVTISSSTNGSVVLDLKDTNGNLVGQLTLNADGTDSLEVMHRDGGVEFTPVAATSATAAGPVGSLLVDLSSSGEFNIIVSGSDGDANPAEFQSPNGDDLVNTSHLGWAVKGSQGQTIEQGESITFSFVDDGDNTTAYGIGDFKFKTEGYTSGITTATITARVYLNADHSIYDEITLDVTSDEVVQISELNWSASAGTGDYVAGADIYGVQIESAEPDGSFRLNGVEIGASSDVPPADLDYTFTLNVVDGDGDTVTQTFTVHLDGDTSGGLVLEAIAGTSGADVLVGTSGNDVFIGGAGDDIFQWNFGDQGTGVTPAVDTIVGFGDGADKLDLHDLLQGENAGNLSQFLHFNYELANNTTTIDVKSGDGSGAVDQKIVLVDFDITVYGTPNSSPTDDAGIAAMLLSQGKLVIDG